MKTENGKTEGDLLVEGELALHGMVTGNITVAPNASLHLHGMCCGDLVVSNGATVIVFGTVGGNLLNHGVVELRGVVTGNVLSKDGHLQRAPSAVIGGAIET